MSVIPATAWHSGRLSFRQLSGTLAVCHSEQSEESRSRVQDFLISLPFPPISARFRRLSLRATVCYSRRLSVTTGKISVILSKAKNPALGSKTLRSAQGDKGGRSGDKGAKRQGVHSGDKGQDVKGQGDKGEFHNSRIAGSPMGFRIFLISLPFPPILSHLGFAGLIWKGLGGGVFGFGTYYVREAQPGLARAKCHKNDGSDGGILSRTPTSGVKILAPVRAPIVRL